ncbi:hypothetical protein JAAARDRAFT_144139, partial [Jaapia argillacea MUCL 33604]
MLSLEVLLRLLDNNPGLLKELTLGKIFKFVTGAAKLKDDILLCQPASHPDSLPPDFLPPSVDAWLSQSAAIPPRQAVFFTLDQGARPAYSIHLYCEKCNINYHHNYFVHDGMRTYYNGIPDVIQVAEHQFVERRLIELWTTLMLVAWTSATNCARLFNLSMSLPTDPRPQWQFGFALTSEEVWDGFVILALLEDQEARGGKLIVPHRGDQRLRFTEAIQALVTDGVTVGHPCCAVHNCHIPLANNRHRFCPNHANEEDRCSIIGCESNVTAGKRTCADPLHQDVERTHTERGQARFQLKQRLERARVAHPNDALPVEVNAGEMEDIDLAEEQYVESPSGALLPMPTGLASTTLRAQFGRKRTHNEQLIVAPCGMIHARETFFGAEAVSSVAEMIRRTYYYPGLMPDHIFYDNNCTLRKHVQNDPVFQDVGLTVDVFHFKSKHSE